MAPLTLPALRELALGSPSGGDRPIAGITADSRKVRPGWLFVAVPGTKADGMDFVPDAVARGAAAVIGEAERPAGMPAAIAYVQVPDARRALALVAARFYPGQPETMVAVTGTSGKSSVADFTRQLFAAVGRRSASLGTLGLMTSDGLAYGSLTTPDPVTLHETLDRLSRDGISHLAMEASSHGLDQRRLDGVRLAAAAFTNLGRDHLDYHPTVEEYLRAKLRLFDTLLEPGRPAVVNADGAYADRVIAAARARGHRVLTTGRAGEAIRLLAIVRDGFDQRLRLSAADASFDVLLPLAGDFQVENALLAAGLAIAVGADPARVLPALGSLRGVPGRMERVGQVDGALCIVDYAHKPEALAHVLDALRPFATGRLVCVFGCGGDRDRGKRPIMGAIAAEKADAVVVTDDNPRSEDPGAIRAEILKAAPGAREIGDRAEAIRTAVRELEPGDVLVVAGKGHETGQIVGERTLPFSDHEVIRQAIIERQA
ncbi:UDP-N-acetylmuramoyl-L-alanyl-D-glutamate--2,6-diaminopimelate ligase [Enterovirga aerilata]|uniref:UDP-N-acetylmuramoyl-L-alanyl-D-glutamate--2,6-diaminopimelate ligase n=1 Tax=Enterovirga aerilata TaxID=2730920 RepID=A0A849I372_9HYPH|nr:UDP-N-acetylmuramoyl-L-alanyl-D-glutamate--2,6-diaminopimelate ligase [Enterovirga sp. DB1703]NNM70835.1 UDP-N-acetylmuramoyl-L-alanyl-D-glutamate--2,6-diaminopimelate ligase [Enterovirga sp. DB1703]